MIDFKPNFEKTVNATKDLNDAAVEYIDGIEVIKAFGKQRLPMRSLPVLPRLMRIPLFHG